MSEGVRLFSPYDGPMWDSVAEGALRLQRCDECGAFRYPPGPACPECLAMESCWTAISGRARLIAWTVFHRQYLPAYAPPVLVVAVQLEEGPLMVSNMPPESRNGLRLDAPLEVFYDRHPDGYALPRFRLAGQPPTSGLPAGAQD